MYQKSNQARQVKWSLKSTEITADIFSLYMYLNGFKMYFYESQQVLIKSSNGLNFKMRFCKLN